VSSEAPLALVTGTSSGIGRAVAMQLLGAGWRVQGLDLAPPAIEDARFVPLKIDLSDGQAVDAWLAQSAGGTPQAVVHAAGVLRSASLGALAPDDTGLMWRLHVDCAQRLGNALLPRMCDAGSGRFVLVGSRVWEGVAGRSAYAATKAALHSLGRSWAAEVADRGVTVNVVSPAATRTGMLTDGNRGPAAPRVPPIGRLIEPEEVAQLVAYLLSPAAAAITGQDIAICGGSSVRS
jgi:NAD(P)-dependent dehydrogenase (short-subunit alcohol dehydrogenase family)